ncbi:MAG: PAS domain-containing protein [Rhodospirillales bacterium]
MAVESPVSKAPQQTTQGYPVVGEADIASAKLRELWRHWLALHRNGRPPSRADFDPAAIPHLLPYLMLVDVVEGGKDFRYRLVGTHVARIHGADNTGRLVSHAFASPDAAYVMQLYRRVVESGGPVVFRGEPPRRDHRVLEYEIVHLPLVGLDGRIGMVLVGLEFTASAA